MIERTSREYVLEHLQKNHHNWKILDIGCNQDAVEYAQTVADTEDFSKFYKDKKFILIDGKDLPFENNEFDFVYASHVIEHVEDIVYFTKELQRISKHGYIELPSMLEDNIILSKNASEDHRWFFKFDDVNKVLLVEKKKQLIEPFLTHGVLFNSLRKNFRSSLVIELIWKNNIDLKFENFSVPASKTSFWVIIKKYISYYIRNNKKKYLIAFIFFIFLIIYNFFS